MPALQLHRIYYRPRSRFRRVKETVWREWCFLRAVAGGLKWRFVFLFLLLLAGAALFRWCEPEKGISWLQGIYYSWSLVFGQAPESFPEATPLRILFFAAPVLGLTVIIEGILEFAHVLRDRRGYERNWCRVMAGSLSQHVILVGCGRLGYRIFSLLNTLEVPLVVIENDATNPFLDDIRKAGVPLIIGDGRREALFQEANIVAARSVILATNDDMANMEMALDARRLKPGIRVVLRMFDQTLADKVRDAFDIHLAMSQAGISAPAFATAAIDPSIVNSFVVDDQLIVMQRWTVRPDDVLAGLSVGELPDRLGFNVVEIRSANGTNRLFPPPDARLSDGDQLLVQGPYEALRKLEKKLKPDTVLRPTVPA